MYSASALPPEIWVSIFDHATFVPHSLDHEVQDPFASPRSLGTDDLTFAFDLREDVRTIRRSLRTKSAISRVCRTWQVLVTRLLYEVISVTRNRHIICLSQLLNQQEQSANVPDGYAASSLGWYTRRLDIVLPREHFLFDHVTEISLVQLIHHLPRLEISIVYLGPHDATTCYIPSSAVKAFRTACAGSLRKLVWQCVTGPEAKIGEDSLFALTESARQLRALVYRPFRIDSGICCVHTETPLSFAGPVYTAENVKHVNWYPHFTPMPTRYWPSAAQWQYTTPVTAYVTYPTRAHWIYDYHPASLRQVVFFYSNAYNFVDDASIGYPIVPHSVTHIGFHFGFAQASSKVYRALRAYLALLIEQPHIPKVVRIMSGRIMQDLMRKHSAEFKLILQDMAGRPFKLEDHLGRELN